MVVNAIVITSYAITINSRIDFFSNASISDGFRYDQMNHWASEVPNKKRRRCAGDNLL